MKRKIFFLLAVMVVALSAYAARPLDKTVIHPKFKTERKAVKAAKTATEISIAEAIAIGNDLGDNTVTEDEYTVWGYVVNARPYYIKTGTQTYAVATDAENSEHISIQVYDSEVRLYSLEAQVVNGDYVGVTGKIQKYGTGENAIIEFVQCTTTFTSYDKENNGVSPLEIISVESALKKGAELNSGDTTDNTYLIIGYVSAIAGRDNDFENFGNQTYWITDDPQNTTAASNADGAFEVYRGKGNEKVAVGDRVVARTRIFKYSKGDIVESAGVNLPVLKSNPVGLYFDSHHYAWDKMTDEESGEQFWYFEGADDTYGVGIDIRSESSESPVGTYDVTDNTYTYFYDPSTDKVTTYPYFAQVEVKESNETYTLTGVYLDFAGNLYYIQMGDEQGPITPQQTYTIRAYIPEAEMATENGYYVWWWGNNGEGSEFVEMIEESADVYKATIQTDASMINFLIANNNDWTLEPAQTEDYYGVYELNSCYNISRSASDAKYYIYEMQCDLLEPRNVLVHFYAPEGTPEAGVEIIGTFDEWEGTKMYEFERNSWEVLLSGVRGIDFFKFREAGSWANEPLFYNYKTEQWEPFGNLSFGEMWYATAAYDFDRILEVAWNGSNYIWSANKPITYYVTLYAPTTCGEQPAIIGDFNNWESAEPMNWNTDEYERKYYWYEFNSRPGENIMFVAWPGYDEGIDWINQLQYYNTEEARWYDCGNYVLTSEELNPVIYCVENYRFGRCTGETAVQVAVLAALPQNGPENVEIIGNFGNGWTEGVLMDYYDWESIVGYAGYKAIFEAEPSQYFKFRSAGSWDREIEVYDEEEGNWRFVKEYEFTFSELWVGLDDLAKDNPTLVALAKSYFNLNDDAKVIMLDLTNEDKYRWTVQKPRYQYTVYFYPPVCESDDYVPGIAGDFNDWKEYQQMEPVFDGEDLAYYYTNFYGYEGDHFEIVDFFDNENIIQKKTEGEWENYSYFGLTNDDFNIKLDFANEDYRWKKCASEPQPQPYPTPEYLAQYYDVDKNIVLCFQLIEDAVLTCDNDIYFVSSGNNWGKGDDKEEKWENCALFEELKDFPGWYVVEEPYEYGMSGKPMVRPANGDWTWSYQCGDVDAWNWKEGKVLDLTWGYEGECNIFYSEAGAYIYQLKYWKNYADPCNTLKYDYTVELYAPDACPEMRPAIIGDFNGWQEAVAMDKGTDNNSKTFYSYSFQDTPGNSFKIVAVPEEGANIWGNELEWFNASTGEWEFFGNYVLGKDQYIVLDRADNFNYRFQQCAAEPEVVYIDCGTNFTWNYYYDNYWAISAENDDYIVGLYFESYDNDSPAGTYNIENTLRNSYIYSKNSQQSISFTNIDATVSVDNYTQVIAYFDGDDGTRYIITMKRTTPDAFDYENVIATNLEVTEGNEGAYLTASNGSGQSVEISINSQSLESQTYYVEDYVSMSVNGEKIASGSFTVTIEDEKITITGTVLGYNCVEYDLKLTNYEIPLGYATLNVLIPTDNNMDIDNGVWFVVSQDGKENICVQADRSGRWFSAYVYISAPIFNFYVANQDVVNDGIEGAQRSDTIYDVTDEYSCYELYYNGSEEEDAWPLYSASCEAADHDYRILNIEVNNDEAAKLKLTIESVDFAPNYELYYRPAGEEDWVYLCYWRNLEPTNLLTTPFPYTEDTEIEFALISYNRYWSQATDMYFGNATVKANTDLPTGLDVQVEDNQIAHFSWKNSPNSNAASYAIYVYQIDENGYTTTRGELTVDGIEESASIKLNISGNYGWVFYAYDASGTYLGDLTGPQFTIIAPDYAPYYLQVSELGQSAVLSWQTDPDVKMCYYQIWNSNFNSDWMIAESDNGQYSVLFTPPADVYGSFSWGVAAGEAGSTYFISDFVDGDDFEIKAPIRPTEKYELSLSVNGGVGGYVSGKPGLYNAGAQVTISAIFYKGYKFWKWVDQYGNVYKTASLTVTMDEDKSFEAYFLDESTPDPDPVYYELTASVAEGDGSITWDPTGLSFESGTEITVTATPSSGWKLSHWTLNGEKRYGNPLIFEIKEYSVVEAYFIEEGVEPEPVEEYSFTYRVSGLGEISSSKDPGTYEEGSTITLYATPETDWYFDHWTVNNVEMTSNPLTITLNENTEVIAWFKTSKKFKVTIKAGANGTVKPKYTEEEFLGGDELKITATPDEGYKFDKWKEDGNTEPERTIVITQDTVLTALFADILYYTLRVYIDPTERGTIYFNGKEKSADDEGLCKASFEEGTKVTIEAVANSGWKFVRYEENGKDDVDESEYTITMTKNRTITAVFAKKSQGLDDVEDQNENLSKKVFINGQIYILRGDKLYTIQGQLVK